jgi:hypothetical protein
MSTSPVLGDIEAVLGAAAQTEPNEAPSAIGNVTTASIKKATPATRRIVNGLMSATESP